MPLRLGQNSLPTLIVPCSLWHRNSGRWSRVEEQPGAAGEWHSFLTTTLGPGNHGDQVSMAQATAFHMPQSSTLSMLE